ncbi:hypothetical protein [Pseudomonas sp. Root569]|uniref:hypothetical protein n=1 Tax=Pseudomonas sp. Root569 TaxID=1736566 RepID=UPI00070311CF|nr:hypothetical protein [Pseudomonas sp. Root569]KRA06210.1 hypothetical protein ASD70_15025 [Pseudomonas sp. Root569]
MSQVKERPILFSAPMVRAILEGRKTVTRRAVNSKPRLTDGSDFAWKGHLFGCGSDDRETARNFSKHCCPYGQSGDRLWVRETWAADAQVDAVAPRDLSQGEPIQYPADGAVRQTGCSMIAPGKGRPSIHMPRWASRILLEITDVRVERLQDISEDQAKAEGCFFTDYGQACFHGGRGIRDATECEYPASKHQQRPGWMWNKTNSQEQCLDSARNAFGNLWNSVGGDWGANPWVWVVEFKRV